MKLLRNLLFVTFLTHAGAASGQSVGVFLPWIYETKELVASMKSDPVLAKADIMVFQKLEDFQLASTSKPFDIAILPASYGRYNSTYVEKVPLVPKSGEKSFKHLVVSFKKEAPADFSVGVIDEVGRKNLRKWMKEVCSRCGKQKDVKKAKDLYNMLALGSVDAIMVSPFNLEAIKRESAAELFVLFTAEPENQPMIYVPKGGNFKGLENIKPSTFSPLGLKVGAGK
ncbi:hypothetical protein [Oligoflexus tunisiensis]|uniref:hypothetical protein n=1 Tax=Oligoflexus tunisiensis TaxID=708132 RepID=UPI00114CBFE2|nr:hypothetical protein [Oligoflexus tunisiensis]